MNKFARSAKYILAHTAQWVVFAFLAFATAAFVSEAFKYQTARLDITMFCVAVAASAAVAILLFPPVFFRFGAKARIASYLLFVPVIAALGATGEVLDGAYKRTPQAAAEAKAEAAATASRIGQERLERGQAQEAEQRRKDVNEVKENLRYIAEAQRKVQGCINWRGQVPALVRQVKDSLHNPHSFEHVRTEMRIKGDNAPIGIPVVVMEYRAQNGFGAIRTDVVTATIVPHDCSVSSIKEYDPSDFAGN